MVLTTAREVVLGRTREGEVVRENLLAVHHEVCHDMTIARGSDSGGAPQLGLVTKYECQGVVLDLSQPTRRQHG